MPAPLVPADITSRPVLASYPTYAEAQKAVDTLSDQKFAVHNVAIVGVDLRMVEAVLGRMSWGRAAGGGLLTGMWFGLLVGLFVALFAAPDDQLWPIILLGLLYGAAFGIIFGLVSYAFTGGKRDFVSRQALVAARYDVLVDASVIGQARGILGLSAAPDPVSSPASPAPPAS